jgi:hypothetical protein
MGGASFDVGVDHLYDETEKMGRHTLEREGVDSEGFPGLF